MILNHCSDLSQSRMSGSAESRSVVIIENNRFSLIKLWGSLLMQLKPDQGSTGRVTGEPLTHTSLTLSLFPAVFISFFSPALTLTLHIETEPCFTCAWSDPQEWRNQQETNSSFYNHSSSSVVFCFFFCGLSSVLLCFVWTFTFWLALSWLGCRMTGLHCP